MDSRFPPEFTKNFELIIKDGDRLIFATPGAEEFKSKIEFSQNYSLLERTWTVTLKAKQSFLDEQRSYYAQIALFGGLVGAILTGFLVYTAIRSKQQNRLLQKRTSQLIQKEKKQEELLERLTDSNEELARFAYVCSHDLQEPLRMVQSFSKKLQRHFANKLIGDERGKKYFHFVIDGAQRSQELIKEILSYSEIDRDTKHLKTVDLRDIMEVVESNLLINLQESGGKITAGTLPILECNKTQIYQLLQNLVNNGLKYQDVDTAPHVHVSSQNLGSHWEISVKDNGIVIDPAYQNKIFEVFQRLHRRTEFAGTGVGLAICKKIVERHDGTIRVVSEKGKGSTFIFTLGKQDQTALAA